MPDKNKAAVAPEIEARMRDIKRALAAEVKRQRTALGMTQRELAHACGYSSSRISDFEGLPDSRRAKQITIDTIIRCLLVMGARANNGV